MNQLETTFQDLLQDKISFEATMNAVKEIAKENTCPECKHPLEIEYEANGDSDFNKIAYCNFCGATFSE